MTNPTPTDRPLLRRLTAFTDTPAGGNPAGVWLGDALPTPAEMLAIAAEVGYSETAFLAPDRDAGYTMRYYSPQKEITFCGHATIAAGVLLGTLQGPGTYRFDTAVGLVPVEVTRRGDVFYASLTSVDTRQADVSPAVLAGALEALGWKPDQLDPAIPPKLAWAGAWHLVVAVAERATLDVLDYDYDMLESLMLDVDLTTLQPSGAKTSARSTRAIPSPSVASWRTPRRAPRLPRSAVTSGTPGCWRRPPRSSSTRAWRWGGRAGSTCACPFREASS